MSPYRVASICFYILCIQVFVMTFGIGVVTPVIGVHTHAMGGTFLTVGAAYGSFFMGRLCLTPVVGRLSDLKGRKRFLFAGFLLTAAVGVILISAQSPTVLVIARLLQGAAAALTIPILTAYAGVIAPPLSIGNRMGVFNGLRSIGLAGGLVMGVVILSLDWVPLSAAYLVVTISGLLGLAVLPALRRRGARTVVKTVSRYLTLLRDPLVRRLTLFRISLAMVAPAIVAFLPVLVKATKLEELKVDEISLVQGLKSLTAVKFIVLGLAGASAGVFQIVLGRFLDKRGYPLKTVTAVLGGFMLTTVLAVLPYLGEFHHLVLVSVLTGLGIGALYLPGLILLIKAGRTRGMGTIIALVEVGTALGAVGGSAVAAAVASTSPKHLFQVVALFPLVALVCYITALKATEGGKNISGGTT